MTPSVRPPPRRAPTPSAHGTERHAQRSPVAEAAPASKLPSWLGFNVVLPAILGVSLAASLLALWRTRNPTPTPAPVAADAGAPTLVVPEVRDAGAPSAPSAAPSPAQPAGDGDGAALQARMRDPDRPDPRGGHFSLEDATRGLEGTGPLVAEIETSMGSFTCDLMSGEAPNTVANFVGLARGTRDFWDPVAARWTRRPFYDGSIFHRVIPDFMIQGGDVLRAGTGGVGYEIPDENVNGHSAAGLLCMANHGPNTNGGQFFITEAPKPHLDGSYSIFGRCRPAQLVATIARVPRDGSDRPNRPVFIRHVRVRRGGG
ncbi:MAG: peptidylprolyl isomerase [Polyangiales bacterium]